MFYTLKHKDVLIMCREFAGEQAEYKTPIDRIDKTYKTLLACKQAVTKRLGLRVEGHRQPTASEIRFGHGAVHYRDFTLADFWDYKEHRIKSKIQADDGLIYSR